MSEKITKEQLADLDDAFDINRYHRLLEEYTGIVARPYIAYSYYDSAGDYLGDSGCNDTRDLLKLAYIEVTDNE